MKGGWRSMGNGKGLKGKGKSLKLHLGCGSVKLKGWVNIDNNPGFETDLVLDLENRPLPFEDNSVEEVFSAHFLPYVKDLLGLFKELYRISKPNALHKHIVPFVGSWKAWEDPTTMRALPPPF